MKNFVLNLGNPEGCIETFSGKRINLLNPQPDDICIEDIAHGLANTCRFAGQCRTFYSVAQHVVLVSHIVPRKLAKLGLMHDAQEAYIHDVTRPLKHFLNDYKLVETGMESVIFKAFKLSYAKHANTIKYYDIVALVTEQKSLFSNGKLDWDLTISPLPVKIEPWAPKRAKREFLKRWAEING